MSEELMRNVKKWKWWPGLWANIMVAAKWRNTVIKLLDSGEDVNQRDEKGLTALHWAAALISTKTAALLIERGADVNARDNKGRTPLQWARTPWMRKLLKQHGAVWKTPEDDEKDS